MVKFFKLLTWLLLIMVFSGIGLAFWLQGAERDLAFARPWVLKSLNPDDAPYNINVGKLSIDWRGLNDFGSLHVRNMSVAKRDGEVFAVLPEVDLTLDPLGFLPHRRAIHSISVDSPKLFLTRDLQGVVRLGLAESTESLPAGDFLAFFSAGTDTNNDKGIKLPFRQFAVKNAELAFADDATGTKLVSNPFSFNIQRSSWRGLEGELSMPFTYDSKPGFIDASLVTQGAERTRIINASLQQVPTELACMLNACPENIGLEGMVNAKATIQLDRKERFQQATISAATKKLTLSAPDAFEKPLKFKESSVIVNLKEGFRHIELLEMNFGFADTRITGQATATHAQEGWYVSTKAAASDLKIDKLHLYWPTMMAPDTREWVLGKIKDGSASATLEANLTPEDLNGDVIADDHMKSVIQAKNIDFIYLPGFPEIRDMDGEVTFTGKTMKITAENSGASLTDTKVTRATLWCPDLDHPNVPMEADIELTAPAKDVATILKLEHFDFDDDFALNPETISGTASAKMKLGFDGFSQNAPTDDPNYVNLDAVTYDITAELNNIAQPQLFEGRDITGLSGTLKADTKKASFDGKVSVDGGTDLAIKLLDEGKTTVEAKGSIAKAQFKNFGIPDVKEFGEGSMAVDIAISMHEKTTELQRAEIDFTNLELDVPGISWKKAKGAAATLKLTPSGKNSYGLAFNAPDLKVNNASLTLNEAADDLAKLSLPSVKNANNDFALIYETAGDGYKVDLKGQKLDASEAFARPGSSILADFPPITLNVDLAELALVKTQPLTAVKGTLVCNKQRCSSANLSAQAGKSVITGTIANVNGVRKLNILASDAGDFLRALDITDRMFGGRLSLTGNYNEALTPPQMAGRLVIEKFKLKNSQILARILSIGSLSGLVNVLTGAGIDFDKLGANISHQAGVIGLSNGRAESNAIGITVEGKVDTAQSALNLKGVVVPANMLNSIFGKIPIIGALAGGEGEGLIAFNYSVKGTYADPEVFVNPLSGLTPGFLRGIWGAGGDNSDGKKPDATAPAAEGAAATEPSPARDVSSPPKASQSLVPKLGKK